MKDEGSCTPYYFLPNVQNQDTSWFSRSPFAIDKVLENAKPFCGKSWDCFQAWQTPGGLYKDQWVTHGGDGAGIQPLDCGGDIGYFEHFDGKGKTHPQGFNHNTYGPKYGACDLTTSISRECNGHIPSYFNHPSKPVVPFNLYECGWWRAYDNPRDASIVKFESGFCSEKALLDAPYYPPGQRLTQSVPTNPNCYGKGRSVTDGGLLGAMGTGGDWFTQSVYAFRNTEDGPELGALWHTFAYTNGKPCGMPPDNLPCPKYKAWLTGTVFPWVCMDNGPDDLLCPWNNEQNNYEKCYCDNEPWRGRNNDPQNPREPNWNTKLVYCVVDDSNNMLCDSIILLNNKREGEYNPVTGCTQNACGGYSKKDATFKLQATSWPPQ